MQKDLVSVLTPAYNTEKYIPHLLDSVLSQSYQHIEMIVIDDGSTDNTKEIVQSYIQPFKDKGYELHYFYQDNSGQSVAISRGLQMVKGEFLVWPDSDDFYATDDAIERMVEVLKNAPKEFQMVRTQQRVVKDGTGELVEIRGLHAREEEPANLFEDCLLAKNGFYYTPGSYMVRTTTLYEQTQFDIYTAKDAGQNWQLMLPILYKYRCKTILEPLYTIVERENSHSRGQYTGYEVTAKKYAAYFDTQIETLKRIKDFPPSLISRYEKQLHQDYNRKLKKIAIHSHNRKAAQKHLRQSISSKYTFKDRLSLIILKMWGGTYLIIAGKYVKSKTRSIWS